MAEKKEGFFKRMFRFGKKERDLDEVADSTSDTALGHGDRADTGQGPVAHAEAAANVVADSEAGAAPDDSAGIEPIKDTPPPGEAQKKT